MNLPQLKFMHLDGFLVRDVDLSKRLFSSCPGLESLNIVDCDIQTDKKYSFTMGSLSLKQFAYTYRHTIGPLYREKPISIRLSAPNLEKLSCESNYKQINYDLQNCCDQLSYVNLNITYNWMSYTEKEEYARRMVKLLVAVDKVKQLKLSPGFLKVLSGATKLLNCQLPCLFNLQSLRLESWITRGSLRSIACLLAISPNVKTLILKLNKERLKNIEDDWEVGFSLPGMLSHLKAVRIENAEGLDAELKVLRFLLKHSKGLEEVAVHSCSTVTSLEEMRKKYNIYFS